MSTDTIRYNVKNDRTYIEVTLIGADVPDGYRRIRGMVPSVVPRDEVINQFKNAVDLVFSLNHLATPIIDFDNMAVVKDEGVTFGE